MGTRYICKTDRMLEELMEDRVPRNTEEIRRFLGSPLYRTRSAIERLVRRGVLKLEGNGPTSVYHYCVEEFLLQSLWRTVPPAEQHTEAD